MKTLENWIQKFIEEPINFEGLNNVEIYLEKKLKKLSFSKSSVRIKVLRQFHLGIRGHEHEDAIWTNVLWYLSRPLPVKLAHDLIDRGVAIPMMAHTRQKDEVQWRLATINENALYMLILERYLESQFSVEQFATMLQIYSWRDDGLLTVLLWFKTESIEKETAFVRAVERELKRFGKLKQSKYKRSGALHFKRQLAAREDIIERLGKKYQKLI